jgi:outer membrane lipoprotein-sorting protein
MRTLWIPLLLILALPARADDERALLEGVRKAYVSSPSFTATFTQAYAPAGFPEVSPEKGTLVLQAPDKVRFDYEGPEGKVFTFDGKAARQYVAADQQLIVKSLSEAERARLPLLFFESASELMERFNVTRKGRDLTLVPRAAPAGDEVRKLELGTSESGEVTRLVIVDAGGNRTTFTFGTRKAGPARPATDFALVPPDGTRIVTE